MKCISVQQMPNGFEVETPTFSYWFKAGAAFTTGAVTVGFALSAIGWTLMVFFLGGLGLLLHR